MGPGKKKSRLPRGDADECRSKDGNAQEMSDAIVRMEETARSYRLVTQPPIDIGEEWALVCGLPTAIKGKAGRRT